MKTLAATVLLRADASREIKCRSCGRPVLCFDGSNQICHAPPECAWFSELMEANKVEVESTTPVFVQETERN